MKKHFAAGIGERGAQKQADWKNVYKSYSKKYPSLHKELELISKNIKLFDVVVLLTDHDDFDYKLIEKDAKLIVDTRGRFNHSSKMTKA